MSKTVLLTATGSAGDVHPLIAVGIELKRQGQRPIIVVNEHFEPLARQNNMEFIPLGNETDFLKVAQNPDLWHSTKSFRVLVDGGIVPFVRPLFDIISQFDPANTIIAASGFQFGARVAHEKLGMPWVTLHLQPVLFRTVFDTPPLGGFFFPEWLPPIVKRGYFKLLDAAIIDPALGPAVNTVRQELGLPPQKHFYGDSFHAPQMSLGLFPDWFAPPQPDWPAQIELTGFVRFDGGETAELSPDLADFLEAGEPPLVFTAGSAMLYGQEFFQTSVAAAQQLGRRAVLVARGKQQIPDHLPETILHVDYVPFSLLLPHAAAFIHHGGIGTVAQALAAGVPQLVRPITHDQPDNGRRLEKLGVAAMLLTKQYKDTAVAQKLDQLLSSPEVRNKCQKWARRVDFSQALQHTCQRILAL